MSPIIKIGAIWSMGSFVGINYDSLSGKDEQSRL